MGTDKKERHVKEKGMKSILNKLLVDLERTKWNFYCKCRNDITYIMPHIAG